MVICEKKGIKNYFFLGLMMLLSACHTQQETEETASSQTSFIEESTSSEQYDDGTDKLRLDNYFKKLFLNGQDPEIKLSWLYNVDWHDEDWNDIDFSIDKVKIVEVNSFEIEDQQKYRGLIAVHYDLKNDSKQDLSIYPEKMNLVFVGDKKSEPILYLENWENSFAANKYTDGFIYFLLEDVENLADAKELSIQFNVKSRLESSSDTHVYQVKLPLELANVVD